MDSSDSNLRPWEFDLNFTVGIGMFLLPPQEPRVDKLDGLGRVTDFVPAARTAAQSPSSHISEGSRAVTDRSSRTQP